MDTTHLVALLEGLSHEKQRLASAVLPSEIAHRKVWVSQLEKQVADEYGHLGIALKVCSTLSIDDLFAELSA